MAETSGAALIARAQRGDAEALGALYDAHHAHIFRYVWSRVGDPRLAEDLTGDVFMRMLAGLPNYRASGAPFRAWLYGIARNRLVDHYRKEGGHESMPLEVAEASERHASDPTLAVEHKLDAERLQRALSALEPPQREVVALRFMGELSVHEVAAVLDKTEAAVKALQHRGLAALRRALARE